ncbi:MAG: Asp-tRNA(Asn)/Glu-tRNA(Gln) amidotransferase subunit GatB [Candidatus Kapaibacterium sp.]
MELTALIGLEIHAVIKTGRKIFCCCKNDSDASPNTNTCPVCLGHAGALPVLNRQALINAIKAGMLFNSKLIKKSRFDRKSYFYPDLPKGYQITQYERPLYIGGDLQIQSVNGLKTVSLRRPHIEEDTAKSFGKNGFIELDHNRAGVGLIEIVTEPDIRSGEETAEFLRVLRAYLKEADICTCEMEKGALRCDVNVSLNNEQGRIVTFSEIKNLNSISNAAKSVDHEIKRQMAAFKAGKDLTKYTMMWDEKKSRTVPIRIKENSPDYRYFCEPDLGIIDAEIFDLNELNRRLPKNPAIIADKLKLNYGISRKDAVYYSENPWIRDFFLNVTGLLNSKTEILKFNGLLLSCIKGLDEFDEDKTRDEFIIQQFAIIINKLDEGEISSASFKKAAGLILRSGKNAEDIVMENDLLQISDIAELRTIVEEIIKKNAKALNKKSKGQRKTASLLVGEAMKHTLGKADPEILIEIVRERLEYLDKTK